MILKYFILFSISYYSIESANPCQTPDGKYGECKPLHQCQSLYQYSKSRNVPPSVRKYIRKSHCGFLENEPKVCCRVATPPVLNKTQHFVSSSLLPDKNSCGYGTENKIIGGEATDLDEFPWMALLDYVDQYGTHYFLCGGALISKRYVLTAAHCIFGNLRSVRLGEYNISSEIDCIGNDCAPRPLDVEIEEKIVFKSYNPNEKTVHDIALLRLKEDVKFSVFIRPICLPTTVDEIFNSHIGENLTAAGWGTTESAPMSEIKLKVEIPVQKCTPYFGHSEIALDEGYICAGGGSKDSCKGDSGGPLMGFKLDEDKDYQGYAFGVVSFGSKNCSELNVPGVYTKVVKYMYWIVDNLKS